MQSVSSQSVRGCCLASAPLRLKMASSMYVGSSRLSNTQAWDTINQRTVAIMNLGHETESNPDTLPTNFELRGGSRRRVVEGAVNSASLWLSLWAQSGARGPRRGACMRRNLPLGLIIGAHTHVHIYMRAGVRMHARVHACVTCTST